MFNVLYVNVLSNYLWSFFFIVCCFCWYSSGKKYNKILWLQNRIFEKQNRENFPFFFVLFPIIMTTTIIIIIKFIIRLWWWILLVYNVWHLLCFFLVFDWLILMDWFQSTNLFLFFSLHFNNIMVLKEQKKKLDPLENVNRGSSSSS